MKRRMRSGAGLAAALLFCSATAWAQAESWIHVRVIEHDDGTKVSVNLPLAFAQVALEVAPHDFMKKGHLKLQEKDLSVADLRRLWTQLKASGDSEFVTVEERDKTVRLTRAGDYLRVDVRDPSEKQTVQVRMPVNVVDALLSGDGETMNISAAIAQLKGQHGEIVTVEGSDSNVRIWIDENRS